MKSAANILIAVAAGLAATFFAICDAIREDRKKRKLGRHYEGPLEN